MSGIGVPYRLLIEPDFAAWREQARRLLKSGVAPDTVELVASENETSLDLGFATTLAPDAPPPVSEAKQGALGTPSVPKAFLDLAEIAACHSNPDRWQLLYRILWRLQQQRDLIKNELDDDIALLRRMDNQVRRDLHKMHAFVRFRMVEEPAQDGTAQEHYIAWYRPDHRILALAVPFFAERFAIMRWTLLTHYASASWDPETKQTTYGPGVPRSEAPGDDELASLWRSYYGAIFNPARLNTRAMKAEMPVRYWQNMPELNVLPTLLQQAGTRVETMMGQQDTSNAAGYVPQVHTLPVLAKALPRCEGCDLFRHATQAVFGVGSPHAALMLIGEQPGDEEDRRGSPFVGPAGKVLDKAVAELGLDRAQMYVTNAVKHFKFVERGKRRIHESPKLRELSACRPWLLAEIDAVQPKVVVCLGASAAKSLLGAKFALMKDRGKVIGSPYAQQVIATLHPSAILRAQDETTSRTLYELMKQDLALAHQLAQQA